MNKQAKLSTSAKREITNDWARSFPSLGVYKTMWLIKRHGPFLMGVVLDRTRENDVYLPRFHVHNLLAPSPAILLSLVYSVPDLRHPQLSMEIKVQRHNAEYPAAVAFLKSAMGDLESPVLTWRRLVELHCDFIRQRRDYAVAKFCTSVFRDVILLAHWCGHSDYAYHCEKEAVHLMKRWNPPVDIASWQNSLTSLIDRGTMQRTLDSELSKHKLQHLPVYELSDSGEAESITAAYAAAWA